MVESKDVKKSNSIVIFKLQKCKKEELVCVCIYISQSKKTPQKASRTRKKMEDQCRF